MTDDEDLGQRVRELRGDRSQQAIALLMAVKLGQTSWRQTTVAKIEAGDGGRRLRATEVAPLAQALGCSIHALLGLPEPTSNDVALQALEQAMLTIRAQYRELGGEAKWQA